MGTRLSIIPTTNYHTSLLIPIVYPLSEDNKDLGGEI